MLKLREKEKTKTKSLGKACLWNKIKLIIHYIKMYK
jgi:hypothetical protein